MGTRRIVWNRVRLVASPNPSDEPTCGGEVRYYFNICTLDSLAFLNLGYAIRSRERVCERKKANGGKRIDLDFWSTFM